MKTADESAPSAAVLRKLDARLVPAVLQLVAQHSNRLRPTALLQRASPVGIEGVVVVDVDGTILGVACWQDFGVRVLLSEFYVAASIERREVGTQLAQAMLRELDPGAPLRVLAGADGSDMRDLLNCIGFEVQRGESFLRRDLTELSEIETLGLVEALPASLRLEHGSGQLLDDAVALWREDSEVHLPAWEEVAHMARRSGAHIFAVGVRDAETGSLQGAVLAGSRGLDSMLFHLVVLSPWRRRRVATALVGAASALLKQNGCASSLVCVHTASAAAFWCSNGYERLSSAVLLQLDVGVRSPQ